MYAPRTLILYLLPFSLEAQENLNIVSAELHSSVSSRTGLENRRLLDRSPAPRIDDRRYDRIHSSLTTVHCFDYVYVKHPVAWKDYCGEYWPTELQESMDRCTGRRDITEMLLKAAINTMQSIYNFVSDTVVAMKYFPHHHMK